MKSGMVVIPCFRYLGSKKIATRTKVIPEQTSHPITLILLSYACADIPTKLTALRLVSNSDDAITLAPKLLPPKKYPSCESSLSFLIFPYVISATATENIPKNKSTVQSINFSPL